MKLKLFFLWLTGLASVLLSGCTLDDPISKEPVVDYWGFETDTDTLENVESMERRNSKFFYNDDQGLSYEELKNLQE